MNGKIYHAQGEILSRSIFVLLLLVGVMVAHGLRTTEAFGQEAAVCLACHGSVVDGGEFSASVHGRVGCIACHADIRGFPHPKKVVTPNCTTCQFSAKKSECQTAKREPFTILTAASNAAAVWLHV